MTAKLDTLPSDFWAKDLPSNEDEALSLLRFGAVQNDMRDHGEVVDQVRTERRMLNCADFFEREIAELRAQLAEVKEALAGDDYASLPSDYPLVRMAHTIRADHDKFRNQVIDTCKRAETAERQRDEALKDAERYLDAIFQMADDGWLMHGEEGMDDTQEVVYAIAQEHPEYKRRFADAAKEKTK